MILSLSPSKMSKKSSISVNFQFEAYCSPRRLSIYLGLLIVLFGVNIPLDWVVSHGEKLPNLVKDQNINQPSVRGSKFQNDLSQ